MVAIIRSFWGRGAGRPFLQKGLPRGVFRKLPDFATTPISSSALVCGSLALCLALAATIGILTIYVNEDLYLSFAAGRDIDNGLLATPDHWSFTAPGRIWINQAWLSHFVFFKAFEKLGPLGPVLTKVILLVGCVGLTV